MNTQVPKQISSHISIPDVPALFVNSVQAYLLTQDGEIKIVPHAQAQMALHNKAAFVCHAPSTFHKLSASEFLTFDVLELFAFVHPAQFCVPTPVGLCKFLGLSVPQDQDDYPLALMDITKALLQDLQSDVWQAKAPPLKIAETMGLQGKGWPWTPFIFQALGEEYDPQIPPVSKSSLNVWKHMEEWSEEAPEPPPSHHPVTGEESRQRLRELLGPNSEAREQQVEYATQLTAGFAPAEDSDAPHVVLAEAGTGVGKTLGYIAPASIWAQKNKGTVWMSTYTKNLQRQINGELDRLYPNKDLKDVKVAVRKGRENYLCLLNFEDTAASAGLSVNPQHAIGAGIMARWIAATGDGDLSGASFPGWLASLLGFTHTQGLADRRGECIFSACDHYHRCFVEKASRKSKRAEIVVANHAVVMIQTALSLNSDDLPKRYIFDEGHHLFDAADSAFAGHLTIRETYDLRRWIRGAEGGRKSRSRGLKARVEDLLSGDEAMQRDLEDIIQASHILPGEGWAKRLKDNAMKGPCETFVRLVHDQVYARAQGRDGPYSLETETRPLMDGLDQAAKALKAALEKLQKPMLSLATSLAQKIKDQADTLESDTKKRLDAVSQSLERRARLNIGAWISMLENLEAEKTPEEFIDWMAIERVDGKTFDIGLYRHWVDPMIPFAQTIKPHAHGIVVTSATLRDSDGDTGWAAADARTGAPYMSNDIIRGAYESPFAYGDQTRVFVIDDVRKDSLDQVASAYKGLFEAAKGSALGLFTAISRLKAVHRHIAEDLEKSGIPLLAQHVDEMDIGSLIDIFRDDIPSCLLGTDAVRDGVDVPGESLRLIVFDRVPWPRPDIMHKARREHFGKKRYDDMITRLKLKQAYGRLIRRADDKGVFVILDSMLPSRLHNAFPKDVAIERLGLSQAIEKTRNFLI